MNKKNFELIKQIVDLAFSHGNKPGPKQIAKMRKMDPENTEFALLLRDNLKKRVPILDDNLKQDEPSVNIDNIVQEALSNPAEISDTRKILDKVYSQIKPLEMVHQKNIQNISDKRKKIPASIKYMGIAATLLLLASPLLLFRNYKQVANIPHLYIENSAQYNEIVQTTFRRFTSHNSYQIRDADSLHKFPLEIYGFHIYFLEKMDLSKNPEARLNIEKRFKEILDQGNVNNEIWELTRTLLKYNTAKKQNISLDTIFAENKEREKENYRKIIRGYRFGHLYSLLKMGENFQSAKKNSGINPEEIETLSNTANKDKFSFEIFIDKNFIH